MEEFDEDMSLPFKDLSENSPHHLDNAEFCYNMDNINQISSSLGIPWEASKDISFSNTPTFLGFIWNLSNQTITLTERKHSKYLAAINEWERHQTHTLQDVQKLHGKLLHASLIFTIGHAYHLCVTINVTH